MIKCYIDGKLSDCDISDCNVCKKQQALIDDIFEKKCEWKEDCVCIASDSPWLGEECNMAEINCTWLKAIQIYGNGGL